MRIEEVHVEGYGALSGATVELDDGLVCLHGVNEAGKSTLLSFIRCVFFGFRCALTQDGSGADLRTAPFDPVAGGTKGGHVVIALEEQGGTQRYRFERKKTGRKVDGELVVEDLTRDRRLTGEAAQREADRLLGGVKEQVFCHLFAVGPDELHAVKSLDRDEVRSVLFTAEAGVGGEFVRTMRRLEQEEGRLFRPAPARKPEINALKRQKNELEREIRQTKRDLADHEEKWVEKARLEEEEQELEQERKVHASSVERARVRVQARKVLSRISDLEAQIAPLGDRRLPDAQTMASWERMRERSDSLSESLQSLDNEIDALERRREGVRYSEVDAKAWPTLRSLPLNGLAQDLEAHAALESLHGQIEEMGEAYAPEQDRRALEDLLRECDATKRQSKEADAQLCRLEDRLGETNRKILPGEAARVAREAGRVDLDDTVQAVERARVRVQEKKRQFEAKRRELGPGWSDERIRAAPSDKTTRAMVQRELAEHGDVWQKSSPGRFVLPVAGLVLVAVGMAVLGLQLYNPIAGTLVLTLGILALAGAAFRSGKPTRRPGEPAFSSQVQEVIRAYGLEGGVGAQEFRDLADDLQQVKREREDWVEAEDFLEQAERRNQETLDRVRAAARAVGVAVGDDASAAEWSSAIQARWEASEQAEARVKALRERYDEEQERRDALQDRWEDMLSELEEWRSRFVVADDEGIKQVIASSKERERLEARARELERGAQRFREFGAQIDRVQQEREEPTLEREGFLPAVHAVVARCEQAFEARKEAQDLVKRLEKKKGERSRLQNAQKEQRARLKAVCEAHGVEDEKGLQEAAQAAQRLKELQSRVEGEAGTLVVLESNHPRLGEEARRIPPGEDQTLLASADERHRDLDERLRECHARQKELHAELDRAVSEDTLGALHAQRKTVEQEIEEAVEQWAELALSRFLLQKARSEYEERHGPRVLKQAGAYLNTLTEGRYERILPGVDGEGYVLVKHDGSRVPAEPPHVSRGAFAQVYLLVRLAFTHVMTQNRPLPYVLDDVLVDFDEGRLERAVQILAELGEDRQVVLLTHHKHVADQVKRAGGTVERWGIPC